MNKIYKKVQIITENNTVTLIIYNKNKKVSITLVTEDGMDAAELFEETV